MNRREVEQAIRDEVAAWPGVSVEFEHGGKHPQAKLEFGGLIMRRAFGGNQDATAFPHKTLADMRRVMAQLGAERAEPEPTKEATERRYRKTNDEGVAKRPDPVAREPVEPEPDLAEKLIAAGAAGPAEAEGGSLAERMAALARSDDQLSRQLASDEDEDEDEESDLEAKRARIVAIREAARQIEDGVYFDLPDDIYHQVEALGSGALVKLLISAGTFWRGSWLDPETAEATELDADATKAMIIGRAYHVARLEPERFHASYARDLAKADFPTCRVWNGTQIGEALAKLGETKKRSGEGVAEQAARLEDAGYDRPIWPLEQARFRAEVAKRDPVPTIIAAEAFDDIERDAARLRAVPEIARLLDEGYSEVSVFWTDARGIRCKARLDKLSSWHWADLKTFVNAQGKLLAQQIADSFRYGRMYVQAVHYRDAIEAICQGALPVRGEASDDQRQMIEQLRASEQPECWYIFQEKGGVPNLLAKRFLFRAVDLVRENEIKSLMIDGTEAEREMAREAMAAPTQIARKGRVEVDRAKAIFQLYSQVYPRGVPWAPVDPVGEIGDLDFNPYWLEGRE